MSVATKNPFAILDDDPSVASDPVPEKHADAAAAPPPHSRGSQKPRGGPASRGGKYYPRGGKPQTRDSTAVIAEEPAPDGQKKFETREGGRGRGRGGRGRGGDRGGDGAGRGGRGRPFDRHSQTGRTDSDKKIHQSWGGDDGNAELKVEQAATSDANNDWATDAPAPSTADWAGTDPAASTDWAGTAPAADWGGSTAAADWGGAAPTTDAPPAEGADKAEGRPRRDKEPEEEDNTLTFDQYLAQKKEKDAAIPKLEGTRQANEGAGDDLWKGAVPLTKQEEEEAYFVGKSKAAPKARAKKEEKVFLEIDARFERPDRGGRGRGGRGGDRGGDRGRGPPRGNYGRGGGGGRRPNGPTSVNVDDQTAFPSLS